MKTILLIGNSGTKCNKKNGQTAKVLLYRQKIIDEGCNLIFVDLENFAKHFFKKMLQIKIGIKKCDRIVLITAQRGARILIPFINKHNKENKPFILPMIGVNILHKYLDNLSENDRLKFMIDKEYSVAKRPSKKDLKNYSKITYILPENNMVKTELEEFFHLKNVIVLNNFRDANVLNKTLKTNDKLRLIFISRISREKGIFNLIDAINLINESGEKVLLDIYGDLSFKDKEDENLFKSSLSKSICFKESIEYGDVVKTINGYDVFVFPTLYYGEGTPGVISESLIASTPIVSSNFAQSKYLLKNNFDSFIYPQNDIKELAKSIQNFFDKDLLEKMSKNAAKSALIYTYKENKKIFLKLICGE